MDAVDLIRSQYKGAHDLLEVTMNDVTDELANWAPPGIANPLGGTYVHTVMAEDFFLTTRGKGDAKPLSMGAYAGKVGISEPPPPPGPGLDEWHRRVKVDLPAVRAYAQAVYKQSDDWLASISAADLDRKIDLSGFGMGEQPLAALVGGLVLQHINNHLGEISCLKGLQGAKGYPF